MLLDIADLTTPSNITVGDLVTVRVPMDNVSSGCSMMKISDDWGWLSLIAESLAAHAQILSYQLDRIQGRTVADLVCRPADLEGFCRQVNNFSDDYATRGIDETDEDYGDGYVARNDFQDALDAHLSKLHVEKVHAPDIADVFMANWTEAALDARSEGGSDDEADDVHPEVECGFWRSCRSLYLGRPLYMSSRSVIFQGIDLDAAECLKVFLPSCETFAFKSARFSPASGVVSTEDFSMEIDLESIESALKCAERLWGGTRSRLTDCRCVTSDGIDFVTFNDGEATYIFGEFIA